MLIKNLKKYKEKYEKISKNFKERIHDFMENTKFKKKDIKRIHERIDKIQAIGTNSIKFVLYIIPESTPRPRLGQNGVFYVKNSKTNNKFMKAIVKDNSELINLITTPCTFEVWNYFPIPESMSRLDKLLAELGFIKPITIPDWDNLGKTYSDMIQNNVILNDSLITDGSSHKRYSFKPRVEIIINYKLDFDSRYNKRVIESSKHYKEKFG